MIKWDGGEYEFDLDKVGTAELREVKRKFGLSLRKLMEGLEELDVDAVTCVYWLVMRSDGRHDDLVLSEDLKFPVVEFMAAWAEGQESEPDPTQDGSLPAITIPLSNGSSTRTSGRSAASTSPPSARSSG